MRLQLTKFDGVLIDLDNTLCNTVLGMKYAVDKFCHEQQYQNTEHALQEFLKVNQAEFNNFQKGLLLKSEFRCKRIEKLSMSLGINLKRDIVAISSEFTMWMNIGCKLYEDSLPFLEWLKSNNKKIGLLTNGPSDGQRLKLKHLNISQFFDGIFISEETGYIKPDLQAFLYAMESLKLSRQRSIIIGDSMEEDIRPAQELGVKAVLLSRITNKSPNSIDSGPISLKEIIG